MEIAFTMVLDLNEVNFFIVPLMKTTLLFGVSRNVMAISVGAPLIGSVASVQSSNVISSGVLAISKITTDFLTV